MGVADQRRLHAKRRYRARCKPKETETVRVAVTLPEELSADVYVLELRCEDEEGQEFYDRTIRLDAGMVKGARWSALQGSLSRAEPSLEVTDSRISVRHPNFELKLDRRSGGLSLLDPGGATIVSAVGPHL